jgi:hypothetical protein
MLDSLRDMDGSGPKGQICHHYDPQITLSAITYWGTIPNRQKSGSLSWINILHGNATSAAVRIGSQLIRNKSK